MTIRAFTVVEILAATTLTATLAISAGSWMLHLQRRSTAVYQQANAVRSVLVVCSRLRRDLAYVDRSRPVDLRALSMTVCEDAARPRQEVAWSLDEHHVIRAYRALGEPVWQRDVVADQITGLDVAADPTSGRWTIHASSGAFDYHLPAAPASAHGP